MRMMNNACFVCLGILSMLSAVVLPNPADVWMAQGRETLQEALQLHHNLKVAKNVILFLGDGMGVSTVTAARIYKGQKHGRTGEETQLNFEKFPNVALSKTYNVDRQTADSAGTATAFLCGVKANMGTVGVDSSVKRSQCEHFDQGKVQSILQWAHQAGKGTGIVTTSRLSHATPSAAYAHSPDRDWEGDVNMLDLPDLCKVKVKDITAQLVEDNQHIKVLLGGGRRTFMPNDSVDPETGELNADKGRRDGKNLIDVWKSSKPPGSTAHYVWNKDQLNSLDLHRTDYLLGVFNPSHMEYVLNPGAEQEPSLAEMVQAAITILARQSKGFFLLVEGARIDHAHHDNKAKLALEETLAFDDAVAKARNLTGDDTLIVVTADHSHVFNIVGYPRRGNDILGLVEPVPPEEAPFDAMPYATLVYANGPGPARRNLTGVDTTSKDHEQSVLVRMPWETHGGEDVAIYALGPMAHLFHGVHEQNYIAHVMGYAACLGPYSQNCGNRGDGRSGGNACSGSQPVLGAGWWRCSLCLSLVIFLSWMHKCCFV